MKMHVKYVDKYVDMNRPVIFVPGYFTSNEFYIKKNNLTPGQMMVNPVHIRLSFIFDNLVVVFLYNTLRDNVVMEF